MPANLDGGAVAARPAAPPAQTRMGVLPLNPLNSDAFARAWGPGYTCNLRIAAPLLSAVRSLDLDAGRLRLGGGVVQRSRRQDRDDAGDI